jgi:hypothetical protein
MIRGLVLCIICHCELPPIPHLNHSDAGGAQIDHQPVSHDSPNQSDIDQAPPVPNVTGKSSDTCDKPFTFIDTFGRCVCIEGYFSNRPREAGCWTCEKPCSRFATCIGPGTCKCEAGYTGDGRNCDPVLPVLINISPKSCHPVNCVVNATFSNSAADNNRGYCRFGFVVVAARLVSEGVFACPVPELEAGIVPVSISFDGEHFSAEVMTLTVAQFYLDMDTAILGISVIAVVIALLFAGLNSCRTKKVPHVNDSVVANAARRNGL